MTWKDLKDEIDNYLKSKGLEESIEIWYIDISFPDSISIGTDGIMPEGESPILEVTNGYCKTKNEL